MVLFLCTAGFVLHAVQKRKVASLCGWQSRPNASLTNNHGFDDERGDYLVLAHDHISYRYEVILILGKGSFGQVHRGLRLQSSIDDENQKKWRPAASA